jgi:large subunit ribosomal protein L24
MSAKIKKGDTIVVIAGRDKGKNGVVLKVVEPAKRCQGQRYLVEGVNTVKKHVKPNPNAGQEGGIISKEASIHSSNVMIMNPLTGKGDRVKFKFIEKNGRQKKVRCFVSNDEMIDVEG